MQFSFSAGGSPATTKDEVRKQADAYKAKGLSPEGATCAEAVADAIGNYLDNVESPSVSVSVGVSCWHENITGG